MYVVSNENNFKELEKTINLDTQFKLHDSLNYLYINSFIDEVKYVEILTKIQNWEKKNQLKPLNNL